MSKQPKGLDSAQPPSFAQNDKPKEDKGNSSDEAKKI